MTVLLTGTHTLSFWYSCLLFLSYSPKTEHLGITEAEICFLKHHFTFVTQLTAAKHWRLVLPDVRNKNPGSRIQIIHKIFSEDTPGGAGSYPKQSFTITAASFRSKTCKNPGSGSDSDAERPQNLTDCSSTNANPFPKFQENPLTITRSVMMPCFVHIPDSAYLLWFLYSSTKLPTEWMMRLADNRLLTTSHSLHTSPVLYKYHLVQKSHTSREVNGIMMLPGSGDPTVYVSCGL